MDKIIPTEHQEQFRVVEYCKWKDIAVFAVPNAGKRNATIANRFKDEGLSSGVPDLMIPISSSGYHGLFIEMKRISEKKKKNGGVSENQREWLRTLQKNGYFAKVAYGADEAIKTVEEYIKWA